MTLPSLLLRASAGTGKTHALVETYVSLVNDQGLRPREIVAITFTKKAAAELRIRIAKRLRSELVAKQPGKTTDLLTELVNAPIGNFHTLALQLLKSFGRKSPLPDEVKLLGDQGSDALVFLNACEDAWFGGDNVTQKALQTLAPYFRVDSELPLGLWETLSRCREDGAWPGSSRSLLGHYQPDTAYQAAKRMYDEIVHDLQQKEPSTAKGVEVARFFLEGVPIQTDIEQPVSLLQMRQSLRRLKLIPAIRAIVTTERRDAAVESIDAARAEVLCEHIVEPLSVLIDSALSAYQTTKRVQRQVDFTELIENVVDYLERDEQARVQLQQRFKAVLVDEAQDTNLLQRRFVRLLAGFTEKQSTASLYVVGDPKQSIYTFRGADPQAFSAFATDLQAIGAPVHTLNVSQRSTPALIATINALGAHVLGDTYQPLEPKAAEEKPDGGGIAVYFPLDAQKKKSTEPSHVALYVKTALKKGARPSDFALLLATMSRAPEFVAAFTELDIPCVLGGGGGLYEQSEVKDLIALLAWLCDPEDYFHAAIALRSPLLGISDSALTSLLAIDDSRAYLQALCRGQTPPSATWSPEDTAIFDFLEKNYLVLHEQTKGSSAGRFVQQTIATFNLDALHLTFDRGEQRRANIERIASLAEIYDRESGYGAYHFVRTQLERMARGHKEPVLSGVTGSEDAVTVSTIHRAKGLEYPVVLLADLDKRGRNDTAAIRYNRTHGIVFRPRLENDKSESKRWILAKQANSDVDEAEQRRLLYVALTRARRELVLFLPDVEKPTSGSFLEFLWDAIPAAKAAGHLNTYTPPTLENATPVQPSLSFNDAAAPHLENMSLPPRLPAGSPIRLSVTQLDAYVRCQRRGYFLYEENLVDNGRDTTHRDFITSDSVPLVRGRVSHQILAKIFEQQNTSDTFVRNELNRLAYTLPQSSRDEIAETLQKFLSTSLASQLKKIPASQMRFEWPFQLRSEIPNHPLLLHGQMDLVYEDNSQLHIVDYKYAFPPHHVEPYWFQLEAYATALARLCESPVTIQTKLVFLRDEPCIFEHSVDTQKQADFLALWKKTATNLLEETELPQRSGCKLATCENLGCGFIGTCHGGHRTP